MADKGHKKKTKGRKANKRKEAVSKKSAGVSEKALTGSKPRKKLEPSKQRNPKAFINASSGRAKKQQARTAEKSQRRLHVPQVNLEPEEPPPMVVLVQGPPGVGKTAVIQALIRHYTRHAIPNPKGPITLVAGKQRRLTLLECPQDLPGMIDAAKFADLVLLVIDGNFGFEMETFEFLNILQVHGFPKVMGVLTHLDQFHNAEALKKTKKALKHRFWAEIYQGAKLFYLSGMRNGHYLKREVLNLARFISIMKLRPLSWRTAHPYLLTDRFEDVTPAEAVERDPVCDRTVVLYGYARGRNFTSGQRMHLAGVGDFSVTNMAALPDPCPLPGQGRKKGLNDRERLVYAPMADVGGLLFDKDAVYIDLPDWKISYTQREGEAREPEGEGAAMVQQLARPRAQGVDAFLAASQIQLFKDGLELGATDAANGDPDAGAALEAASSSQDDEAEEAEPAEAAAHPEPDSRQGRVRRPALPSAAPHQPFVGGVGAPPHLLQELPGPPPRGGTSGDDSEDESHQGDDDDDEEADEDEDGDEEASEGAEASEQEPAEQLHAAQGQAAAWKQGLAGKAAALFSQQHASLARAIYSQAAALNSAHAAPAEQAAAAADSDSEGELFVPKSRKRRREEGSPLTSPSAADRDPDADDSVRFAPSAATLAAWAQSAGAERLRDRFVTGDWDAGAQRDAQDPGLAANGSDVDDDAAGDFEDIEAGVRYGADGDEATRTAMAAIQDEEAEQRKQSKAAKKAAFDDAYDEGGAKGVGEDGQPPKRAKKQAEPEDEGDTFYDAMKADMETRARRTREALDALPEAQRVALEGIRPGTYLRLVISGVPQELVRHWDPAQPLLAGGLEGGEEARSHLQLRLKRHRWHAKILKTRDPLVFSIGWRRFQSMPVYATEDANGRLRMLKYTPEHMHCMAQIYCPMVPANTGVLAIQSLSSSQQSWRISATGVVVGAEASPRVVKKLKMVGEPFRVHKHTAFVHNMFNSPLEVAKFEGASIRTVSGIRGTIKKALRPGVKGAKAGSFRAAFEDKVLLSDLVFLRAWLAVDLPRLYNPVTNLLAAAPSRRTRTPQDATQPAAAPEPATGAGSEARDGFVAASSFQGPRPGFSFKAGPQGTGYYPDTPSQAGQIEEIVRPPSSQTLPAGEPSSGWVGMQTVAQLRRSLGLGAPRSADSLYKPVLRAPRKFHPLKIPRTLQEALPFASKPKQQAAAKRQNLDQRRAVVREPGERKVAGLIGQLQALRNQRTQRRRAAQAVRNEKRQKEIAKDNEWRQARDKEIRKRRYVLQGQAEKHKTKAANAKMD